MSDQDKDPVSNKIELLILESDNPKDRAILMIMNKLTDKLDENTSLTVELIQELKSHVVNFETHVDNFEEHEKKEMAWFNQGRGFLRAAVIAFGLIQSLGGIWLVTQLNRLEQVEMRLTAVETRFEKHRAWDSQGQGTLPEAPRSEHP